MKVSSSKTQCMVVNEKIDGQVNLRGVEIEKAEEFNYVGSTDHSNGVVKLKDEYKQYEMDGG